MAVRKITLISILACLLIVQEQVLSFLPNIQLTVLFIFVYSKTLKFVDTAIILFIHVLIDNILMSSLYLIVPMYIAWLMIPIFLNIIFRKQNNIYILVFLSIILSIIYCIIMGLYTCLFFKVNIIAYFSSDILFTTILCVSSAISVLWLYTPLQKLLNNLIKRGKLYE